MGQTYIVAWDGSDSAESALNYAVMIAGVQRAKLVVWQAFQPPRVKTMLMSEEMTEVFDTWLNDTRQRLIEQIKRRVEPLEKNLEVDGVVYVGNTYEGLIDASQNYKTSMIFMGRGKEGGRIGGLVLKVLRTTRKPVVVVPTECSERMPQRILVPVDLTIQDSAAIDLALDLAHATGARIDILHIIEIYLYESPQSLKEALEELIRKEFEQWRQRNVGESPGVEVSTHVRKAVDAASGIGDFIESNAVDLVVMDSHTHGPLMHLLLGSVAEKIIQKSPVPIMVTKPNL